MQLVEVLVRPDVVWAKLCSLMACVLAALGNWQERALWHMGHADNMRDGYASKTTSLNI